MDVTEFGFIPVEPDDTFNFHCSRCGDCCRNVKDAVMLESLDLFRLARFLKMEIQDVILQYTNTAFLSWCYPVFMLKTNAPMDSCLFLRDSMCSVQSAKPRTCRTYPLGFGPDDEHIGAFQSFIVSKKEHHFTGQAVRVGDWMDSNLSIEDRAFILVDYREAAEFSLLLRKLDKRHEDLVIRLMLLHKYIAFDTSKEFNEQYVRNNAILKAALSKLAKNNGGK